MINRFVPISNQQIRRRRFWIFGLVLFSTLLATLKWIAVIPSDTLFLTKLFMILLFILSFLVSFGLILLSSMFLWFFRFGAVALSPLILPILVPFTHWLMKPLESAISKGYIKKSKNNSSLSSWQTNSSNF